MVGKIAVSTKCPTAAKLVEVFKNELVLEGAAWIADDGRFQQALENCEYNEVEMYPSDQKVVIGRGAILDAVIVSNVTTHSSFCFGLWCFPSRSLQDCSIVLANKAVDRSRTTRGGPDSPILATVINSNFWKGKGREIIFVVVVNQRLNLGNKVIKLILKIVH